MNDVLKTGGGEHDFIVGVVGAGSMGIQIAECFIEHSYRVILKTRDASSKENIYLKIKKHLSKRGDEVYVAGAFSFLSITDSYDDLFCCDLIVESVVEDYEVKCEVFQQLCESIRKDCIVVTNTSALSVSRLSDVMPHLLGMHFFNPVNRMRLVELVSPRDSDIETIGVLKDVCSSLEKVPIIVSDSPGFLVNRLLLPQINNAIKMNEAGIASMEDIDSAVKLGLNHSMGPFELADFIGLDVCYYILNEMYEVSDDSNYRPAAMLKNLVSQNKLGYKTGSGFYQYPRS